VRVQGYTIDQFTDLSAGEAARAIGKLKFKERDQTVASGLIPEIQQRLRFMGTVGLGYLALGRSAKTLSGGESQRIRLAAQLGSNLRGVLYVLDEPTIGLHPRDNQRLLETLTALRNKGNSLIVVEHDEETMRRADHIIDLGPRAGIHGGEVVVSGTLSDVQKNPHSETARCLKSQSCHPIRGSRRSLRDVENWIEIRRARANNLKDIDVRFPIGRLSVITGISGSGKSTLMHEILLPAVKRVWGAHACSVLVKAFCLHELPNYASGPTVRARRKVRCRNMRQAARYERALPGLQTASRRCTKSISRRSGKPRARRRART